MAQSLSPVLVSFSRFFVRGTLKGMMHEDSIRHVSREAAESWIDGIIAAARDARIDYTITMVEIDDI